MRSAAAAAVLHDRLSLQLDGFERASAQYVSLVIGELLGACGAGSEGEEERAWREFLWLYTLFFSPDQLGAGSSSQPDDAVEEIFRSAREVLFSPPGGVAGPYVLQCIESARSALQGWRPQPGLDLAETAASGVSCISSVYEMGNLCARWPDVQPVFWACGDVSEAFEESLSRYGQVLAAQPWGGKPGGRLYQFSTRYEAYLAALMVGLGKDFCVQDARAGASPARVGEAFRDALCGIQDAGVVVLPGPEADGPGPAAEREAGPGQAKVCRKEGPRKEKRSSRRPSSPAGSESSPGPAAPQGRKARTAGRERRQKLEFRPLGDENEESGDPDPAAVDAGLAALGIGPRAPRGRQEARAPSQEEGSRERWRRGAEADPDAAREAGTRRPQPPTRSQRSASASSPANREYDDGGRGRSRAGSVGQADAPGRARDAGEPQADRQPLRDLERRDPKLSRTYNHVIVLRLPRDDCGPQFLAANHISSEAYVAAWYIFQGHASGSVLIHFRDTSFARGFMSNYNSRNAYGPDGPEAKFALDSCMDWKWIEM